MLDAATRASFWNGKILGWERSRYSLPAALNPFAWTVRSRLGLASRLLTEELAGEDVLDLGCGTGQLARAVAGDPERRYVGVDFSSVAIAAARARFARDAERVRFERADAVSYPASSSGVCVFLGLLDWLPGREPKRLFESRREPRLLFSFTEPSGWFAGLYARYRRRVDATAYLARAFKEEEVLALLDAAGYRADRIVRGVRLGPAGLVLASRK